MKTPNGLLSPSKTGRSKRLLRPVSGFLHLGTWGLCCQPCSQNGDAVVHELAIPWKKLGGHGNLQNPMRKPWGFGIEEKSADLIDIRRPQPTPAARGSARQRLQAASVD